MDTKEKIAVMQAWLDGKVILRKRLGEACFTNQWTEVIPASIGDLTWDWLNNEYRVKPEPIEAWAILWSWGGTSYFDNKKLAQAHQAAASCREGARLVKLVEVPEE